jgi:hypothetical protein
MAGHMSTRSALPRLLRAAAWALAVSACSASGEHRLGTVVDTSDAAVAGQGGSSPVPWQPDGSADSGACQTAPLAAQQAPLDMYLMVESSMANQPPGSNAWDAVARGIGGFVTSTDVGDVGVGIQRFPLSGGSASAECAAQCGASCECLLRCGCGSCDCVGNACRCASRWFASCELADYASPAVEIAPLPASSSNMVAWLFTQPGPEGPATTRPALQGAVQHAQDWASAHPGRNVIVVLILNGMPSEEVCRSNGIADMTQVAAAAADGSPSVSTFVVAAGSNLAPLVDPIAAAGGSGHAWNIGLDLQRSTRLSSVLAQIRDEATACQYAVPKPGSGSPDYAAIGVEVRLGFQSAPSRLLRVAGRDACGAGGWYYDDPGRPSRIILCDSTCSAVLESSRATVSTLAGCPPDPAPPR